MLIRDTSLEMIRYVLPEYTNPIGFLYGGRMMNWIVTAGTLAASRFSKGLVVLGSMDDVFFINPVEVGNIVILRSQIEYVGTSSMEVSVKVWSENPKTGKRNITTLAYLAYVAVDENIRPRPINRSIKPSPEEEDIFKAAYERRLKRLERLKFRRALVKDISDPTHGLRWRLDVPRVVFPEDAYMGDVMFAGRLLLMMDELAAILASKYARGIVVTAGLDAMDFYSPIRIGEVVNFKIGLNFIGRTSMELGVKVIAENILSGDLRHTCTAYLTFVNIDDMGRPSELPRYEPITEIEKLRWNEALKRRERRLKRLKYVKELILKN